MQKIAFDERHRQVIKFNISKYDAAVTKGFARYRDLTAARECAGKIKREVLAHWGYYLREFEPNITSRGVQVLWLKIRRRQLAMSRIFWLMPMQNCWLKASQ